MSTEQLISAVNAIVIEIYRLEKDAADARHALNLQHPGSPLDEARARDSHARELAAVMFPVMGPLLEAQCALTKLA